MSSAQEVQLSGDKLGESVDECDALLKKHEAFERLMQSQEEKVNIASGCMMSFNCMLFVILLCSRTQACCA